MNLPSRLSGIVNGSVRYRLLVLVLFPILLVMPAALALAVYWGRGFTYDQLFIKVNTDLSVAHDAFLREQRDILGRVRTLAESFAFRTALAGGDRAAVDALLARAIDEHGFAYLALRSTAGKPLHWGLGPEPAGFPASLLIENAGRGIAGSAVEIFSSGELSQVTPALAASVRLELVDTPRAAPVDRAVEDRGMMIRVAWPVTTRDGAPWGILDGGVLLNNNFAFVDSIRDLVYGAGSLPEGSIGTVTVFIDDVRISTNVPVRPGERALGTRVSDEVRRRVLDRGETWIDRAFVVNDWYISSYEPIVDVRGERVGMLYAGFLEAPFRRELQGALAMLVAGFVVLMLLSATIAIRGARSIFGPIEAMTAVVRATRDGAEARVGDVGTRDEVGELARELDDMLERLAEQREALVSSADQLEHKVAERTAELEHSNAELRQTIAALRDTRRRLVVVEKLAALGELTAGVAHEINNPTQVMLGNLEVIEQELGEAAEPVREEIRLVIDQIYRIQDIIDNLLKYARPGEYAGYVSEVDVNDVVVETLKLVEHLRKDKPFTVDLALAATRTVRISRHELTQVLVNLLVNAVHALVDDGGDIEITSRDWDDKGVAIAVADDGVGMDAEALARVFDPFFSTKGQGLGSGLGLSVSYGLVRRYGGNITAESIPGAGSVFTLWLLSEPVMASDEETIVEQLRSIEENYDRTGARPPMIPRREEKGR